MLRYLRSVHPGPLEHAAIESAMQGGKSLSAMSLDYFKMHMFIL